MPLQIFDNNMSLFSAVIICGSHHLTDDNGCTATKSFSGIAIAF